MGICPRLPWTLSYLTYMKSLAPKERLKRQDNESVAELEQLLVDEWAKLDKILLCSKQLPCMMQYKGSFILGGRQFKATWSQSLSFILEQIQHISERLSIAKK